MYTYQPRFTTSMSLFKYLKENQRCVEFFSYFFLCNLINTDRKSHNNFPSHDFTIHEKGLRNERV